MRLSYLLGCGLIAATLATPSIAAEDMHLRYITLYDGGWYNVDPIMLHWKTPEGETFSKKMSAKIESGENKNCKKDRKHIYDENSNAIWWLEMGGTTVNNNRCENVSKNNPSYTPDTTIKGNSNYCMD